MKTGVPEIMRIPTYELPEGWNYTICQDILGCTCGGVYKLTDSSKVLLSYPERFEHKCDRCGNIVVLPYAYPRQYIKPKEDQI